MLEGELTDGDRTYARAPTSRTPPAWSTARIARKRGCRVLTVQGGKMATGDSDFHLAGGQGGEQAGGQAGRT